MASEKIIITFSPNGKVNLETKGFKGSGCIEASRFIEEALGKIGSIVRTGEYYEEEEKEVVQVKNGSH